MEDTELDATRRERPGGADRDPFASGRRIGRFIVRARLGEGGMGIVLAALDPDLDRPVALKLVADDARASLRARLLREAKALARIEHPNVVRVYEVGTEGDRVFVAMELVAGATLADWLARPGRSWREIVAMFEQVALGLAAAHRAGIVHRDFKPDNVLVDREGRAKVADFGLARFAAADPNAATDELSASLTRTGVRMGTPGFMAPEQYLGSEVDARADQYAFCVALGAAVFGRETPSPGDHAPRNGPRALRAAIERGLSRDPAKRFPSMEALHRALVRSTSRARSILFGASLLAVSAAITAVVVAVASPRAETEAQTIASETKVVAPTVTPIPTPAPISTPTPNPTPDPAPSPTPPPPSAPPSEAKLAAPPSARARGKIDWNSLADRQQLLRATFRDFGYAGLTFDGTIEESIADLRTKLAATEDDYERGVLLYGFAAAERRRGNCTAAETRVTEAIAVMDRVMNTAIEAGDRARLLQAEGFRARTVVVRGLCGLTNNKPGLGVRSLTLSGLPTVEERDDAKFAFAVSQLAYGDEREAMSNLAQLRKRARPDLLRQIEAFERAAGLRE